METKALCVTVEEMAKRLSISRATAYGLVKRKDFPAVTIGRRILVPVACLETGYRKAYCVEWYLLIHRRRQAE